MAEYKPVIVRLNAKGQFDVPGVMQSGIERVDIADVDLVIKTKAGRYYILPGAALAAMSEQPPIVNLGKESIPANQLLNLIGNSLHLATDLPFMSTLDPKELAKEREEQKQEEEKEKEKAEAEPKPEAQVSTLTVNTEQSVEQMVENIKKFDENYHRGDYDYVPPHFYQPPPAPVSSPPGVPPPISLLPIVNLFMGNVVGTTTETVGSTTYLYGGGGATGSDSLALIGARDALQFSPATITGTSGDDVIYANGSLVGNTAPAVSRNLNAKEFLINVAGYFTTLNDIVFTNVPTSMVIDGAANNGGGTWTLPKGNAVASIPFRIIYDMDAWRSSASNIVDVSVTVSGISTRASQFTTTQNFRFMFMDVTDAAQSTDPTLVYEFRGQSRQIYVLPTASNQAVIESGEGNDIIYGDRNNDTITAGNGNNQIYAEGGNDVVVAGNGNNTLSLGSGNNVLTAGDGTNTVLADDDANVIMLGDGGNSLTLGDGANTVDTGTGNDVYNVGAGDNIIRDAGGDNNITTQDGNNSISFTGNGDNTVTTGSGDDVVQLLDGGGAINLGAGDNTLTVTTSSGAAALYSVTTLGTGTNHIGAGDGLYVISMGNGSNTIALGNGTDGYNSQITVGTGTNNITTGNGRHTITVGAGTANVTTGAGQDAIVLAGGGGVIDLGAGNNSFTVNTAAGGTDAYTLRTSGTGTTAITAGDGNYTISTAAGDATIALDDGNHLVVTSAGNDTVSVGAGTHTFRLGLGTNSLSAGGTNTLDFSDITTTAVVVNLAAGTASGTGLSNSFSNVINVIGSDVGNTITGSSGNNVLTGGSGNDIISGNGGNDTYYGLGGNDTITGGTGADIIYAGDGNNTVYTGTAGADMLYGGTGNNTFISQHAGVTYNGTNGANLVPGQINTVDYSAQTSAVTINLLSGLGTAGPANGDIYVLTPTSGVSSINQILAGSGSDTITDSNGNEYINGGSGNNYYSINRGTDVVTGGVNSDTFYTVSDGIKTYIGGWGGNSFQLGAAYENIVMTVGAYNEVTYHRTPSGVLVNATSSVQTVVNSLGRTISVAAGTGAGWGVTSADASSHAIGDTYTQNAFSRIWTSGYADVIWGGNNNVDLDGNSGVDFIFGGSGNDFVRQTDNDRLDGGAGTDIFYTNTGNNCVTYLDGSVDLNANGIADSLDRGVSSLTIAAGSSPTGSAITYTGFSQGYSGTNFLMNLENIVGVGGNDLLVGNDSSNWINAQTGTNAIYGRGGDDILYCTVGSNTIVGGSGTDTISFENNWYSGANTPAQIFLADASFYGVSDKESFWGAGFSTFQVRTGSTGIYAYSTVSEVENINGSPYDDIFYGNASANVIRGYDGNDIIAGNGGADSLYGGNGNDTFLVTATDLAAVTLFSGEANTDTVKVTGLTSFAAGGISNSKFSSIETFDLRDSASGGTFSFNANDITGLADNGTSSSVTLRLDSGDTFIATTGSGTGALSVLVAASNSSHTLYYYYSDAGHTVVNATNRVGILDVVYG